MENRPRYRVPEELRETLLDFTIAYLLERPSNLIEFGLSYFRRLKDERTGGGPAARSTQQAASSAQSGAGGTFNGGGGSGSNDIDEGTRKFDLDLAFKSWLFNFTVAYMMEEPKPNDIIDYCIVYCETF